MQVTIIPIVIGAFWTVTKGLLKGVEDLEVGGHYWERPEYWEDSWRLEETCCHSNSSEKPSANADVKSSNNDNNNNNGFDVPADDGFKNKRKQTGKKVLGP